MASQDIYAEEREGQKDAFTKDPEAIAALLSQNPPPRVKTGPESDSNEWEGMLAKNDKALIFGNLAAFDITQYAEDTSQAGMSVIHLLAVAKGTNSNGLELKSNVSVIHDMIELFTQEWEKSEFRQSVLQHQKKAISNRKTEDTKKDEEARGSANQHFEELKEKAKDLKVEDFMYGLKFSKDAEPPCLILHIIAGAGEQGHECRKYSTSKHDAKMMDAYAVRDYVKNSSLS
ncbi:hypothetical protein GGR57DRAFT_518128 [Xylariaceae sp. FL1272]|nr:hypothetical protein GGR57DRAFT_518128 [Xylariaceae sp. FL1272]